MDPLLSAFARHLGLPPEQARPLLGDLLAEVRRAVKEGGRARLAEVGVFERTADGLRFQPDDDLVASVNQQYLGLPPITSRRPPMPTGAPPRSAPPPRPAPPAPETPTIFSVPLEPVAPEPSLPEESPPSETDPFEADPFAEAPFTEVPPPAAEAGIPEAPLRDLSSDDEPAPGDHAGPESEGLDPDLEALIAHMREATEPLDLPFFTEQTIPEPEPEPLPGPEADYDFFGTPAESRPEHAPPAPDPEPAVTPPSIRPRDEPRPSTPLPSAHTAPEAQEAPERRRFSPWSLALPLAFLALVAAAVWLWPRLRGDRPAVVTPAAEQPAPAPMLVPPDSAELALSDSLAQTDSARVAAVDSAAAGTPEPASEPETAATDPLRGGTIDPAQGGFGWVFGSGSRAGAEADAARWRRVGFRAAAIAGRRDDGRPVYRVFVGQFTTRDEARAARDRLPAEAPPDAWVGEIGP